MKKKLGGEFLGTYFLLAIVVGSGIMGERLSVGNAAIALLANSFATGLGLMVIITVLGPVSGAHINPLVTILDFFEKQKSLAETFAYVSAQLAGAFSGVVAAHIMFDESLFKFSSHPRAGFSQLFSEFVATFGLIIVLRLLAQARSEKIPVIVGAYIASAYWFTASTSFANPAVTVARSITDTFSGIDPFHVPGFVVAQFFGAAAAESTFQIVFKERKKG